MYFLGHYIVEIFKKFFERIQSSEAKMAHLPKQKFFQKN